MSLSRSMWILRCPVGKAVATMSYTQAGPTREFAKSARSFSDDLRISEVATGLAQRIRGAHWAELFCCASSSRRGGACVGGAPQAVDPNGNGQASLAEVDGWIQKSLITALAPDKEEAIRVWKCFRPSYIRAFNDTKDLAAAAVNESEAVS